MIQLDTQFFLTSVGCVTNKRTTTVGLLLKNHADDGYDNAMFQAAARRVLATSSSLCRYNVQASYVEGSLEECDYLVALYNYSYDLPFPATPESLADPYKTILYGFATCVDKRKESGGDDNSIYIDVICSNLIAHLSMIKPPPPAGGKTLLNIVTRFAKENNYRYVSLSALMNVINYYRKLGFRHIKNGETTENSEITRLAELNRNERFDDSSDAKQRLKVERAFKLAHELDAKGKPSFNEGEFIHQLKQTIGEDQLEEGENDEETSENYVGVLPKHVQDSGGSDGLYDFVGALARNGFSSVECSDITRRWLVQYDEDDDAYEVSCSNEGFIMRKPLFPTDVPGLDDDIVQCADLTGGRRSKTRKSNRHKQSIRRAKSGRRTRGKRHHASRKRHTRRYRHRR